MLLHGSRSGVRKTIRQEFDGTRSYAKNSYIASGNYWTGWHSTVGEDAYSVHMTPREFGWNVGDESEEWYALELAQWDVSQAITDGESRAAVACIKAELVPVWGNYDWNDPAVLQTHAERPQGRRDGKSDVFPYGNVRALDLKNRLRAMLLAD